MSVDIVSPADAVLRCMGTAGMSQTAVEHEGDVSRGELSIIKRRLGEGNPGLHMHTRTLIRVAHACGYRIILATEPGKIDADAFELGDETMLLSGWNASRKGEE